MGISTKDWSRDGLDGIDAFGDHRPKADFWIIRDSEGATHRYPQGYTLIMAENHVRINNEFGIVEGVFYLPRSVVKRTESLPIKK